tara:strand:+ start:935 stop:2572 length:1638 start_codon:yes stop_codon:yes gene_type:complete
MAATIGNLFVNLRANSAPLKKGLKSSGGMVSKFSKGLRGMGKFAATSAKRLAVLGTAAVTAGVLIVRSFMSSIDEMNKMSKVLGMTYQEMREFAHITALAGVETRFAQKSLLNLVRSTGEVANGTGAAKDAFALLGIEAAEMAKQTPMEMLMTLSDHLGNIENQTNRVLVGYRLFGTRGIQMVNMLQEGSAALQEQREQFRRLAGVMSTEAAAKVEEANDAITRLKSFLSGVGIIVTTTFAPAIIRLVDITTDWIESMGGAGTVGVKVFTSIAKSVAFVADILQSFVIGFKTIFNALKWFASQWVFYWVSIIGEALVYVIELMDDEWGKAARKAQQDIKALALEMERAANSGFDDLMRDSLDKSWGDRVMSFADALVAEMEAANGAASAVDSLADAHGGLNEQLAEATVEAQKFIDELDKQIRTFGMHKDAIQIEDFQRAGVDPSMIAAMKKRTATLRQMEAAAKAAAKPLDMKAPAKAEVDRAVAGASVETAIGAAKFAFGFTKNVEEEQLEEAEEQNSNLKQLLALGKQQYDMFKDTFGGLLQ